MDEPWTRLLRAAADNNGVASRRLATAVGVPATSFHGRVRAEGWRRPFPGVALLPGSPDTFRQRVTAALHAAGPDAAASHDSAAYLLGLMEDPPEELTIIVPHPKRARQLPGVRTVRSRTLLPGDLHTEGGIRCTSPTRTILDLAYTLEDRRLTALLLTARQRGRVDLERLGRRLGQRCWRRCREPLLRALTHLEGDDSDSIFEHLVRGWLDDHGLAPRPNHVVHAEGRMLHVDLAFPDERVAVECEGYAYHRSRTDLERDQRRANALSAEGWRVIRISWHRFHDDPSGLLTEIRALLAR